MMFTAALHLVGQKKSAILRCKTYSDALSALEELGHADVDLNQLIGLSWKEPIVNRYARARVRKRL